MVNRSGTVADDINKSVLKAEKARAMADLLKRGFHGLDVRYLRFHFQFNQDCYLIFCHTCCRARYYHSCCHSCCRAHHLSFFLQSLMAPHRHLILDGPLFASFNSIECTWVLLFNDIIAFAAPIDKKEKEKKITKRQIQVQLIHFVTL